MSRSGIDRSGIDRADIARILVVEDDGAVRLSLLRTLRLDGYESLGAADASEAAEALTRQPVDLVILDVGLPGVDGFTFCRRLRAAGNAVPVLMLTARSRLVDRVTGLDCGADDYLAKPFELLEFNARVRALLRRSQPSRSQTLRLDDVEIDPVARTATRDGHPLGLTLTEFELLLLLVRHSDEVLRRDWIFEKVWKYPMESNSNSLEVYVGNLRRKLERTSTSRIIHTVRGIGYVARTTRTGAR